ncbi:MAG: prepilin-type N-terminal cleavage/methylation domain-containing protein [Planctomycetota bacterium]
MFSTTLSNRLDRARRRQGKAKGFTLVEILIVVIILGILAAIVVPQFSDASENARKKSVTSQLQTLRSQVELYKLEHRDEFPTDDGTVTGTWDWDMLTGTSVVDGNTYGPYLQAEPKNSLNGNSTVANAAASGVGFVIDANGKLFATGKTDTNYFNEADGTEGSSNPAGFVAP